MERIESLLLAATVFAAVGTSGHVHPAAGFVSLAKMAGARTIEINTVATVISDQFDAHRTGPATREVPRWVDELLAEVA